MDKTDSLKLLIATIEDKASAIISKAFERTSWLTLDSVTYDFMDDDYSYKVVINCGIPDFNLQKTFTCFPVCGLPDNLFLFNDTEVNTFAVVIANYAISLLDADDENDDKTSEKVYC